MEVEVTYYTPYYQFECPTKFQHWYTQRYYLVAFPENYLYGFTGPCVGCDCEWVTIRSQDPVPSRSTPYCIKFELYQLCSLGHHIL